MLRFFAPAVGRMLDDAVQVLIAHELAHVALCADASANPKDTVAGEQDAINLAGQWGFDDEVIDDDLRIDDRRLNEISKLLAECKTLAESGVCRRRRSSLRD